MDFELTIWSQIQRLLSLDGQIMALLLARPRPAHQIHKSISVSQPTSAKRLRALHEAGLVAMHLNPDDRRVTMYFLTPTGLAVIKSVLNADLIGDLTIEPQPD